MKTNVLLVLVAALVGIAAGPPATACGDKFLVGNSAAQALAGKVQVPPGKIAIFVGTDAVATDWDQRRSSLEQQGHTVSVIEGSADLIQQVREGAFDVVMLQVDQAREMRGQLDSAKVVVLPYINFGTRSQISTAKKEFGQVVQTPVTPKKLLRAIEASLVVALVN